MSDQPRLDAEKQPAICNQPWNTIYVPWNGDQIGPCCLDSHQLGNLNTSLIEEIWNGERCIQCRRGLIENKPLPTCVACIHHGRHFADHIKPFADEIDAGNLVLNEAKRANFERARQSHLEGKEVVDHLPYVIYLDVSSRCQIRCRKCFIYAQKEPPPLGQLSMKIFEKIVPLLPTAVRVICTGVGESLLHPQFIQIVKMIREHDCQVSFNTNGNLLTPETGRQLVECRATEIVFSIDSLRDDLYQYYHRYGNLQVVLDNLQLMAARKTELDSRLPMFGWFFVGMRSNMPELPDVIRRAAAWRFQSIYVCKLIEPRNGHKQEYFDFYDQENVISTEEDRQRLRVTLDECRELAKQLGVNFGSGYDSALRAA